MKREQFAPVDLQNKKKEFTSKFSDGYTDQQTPEEDWRAQRPKRRGINNKYDVISPNVKLVKSM